MLNCPAVRFREVITLSHLHPHMQGGFLKGQFTVKKTSQVFSNLAIDKPYDQHNAGVKNDGGAVGLSVPLPFSGPVMARVIIEFER